MRQRTQTRARQFSVTIVLVVLTWGCAYQPGSLENPGGGINFISQGMEVQMGAEAAAEIESQESIVTDSYVQNYITSLGNRLVQHSRRPDLAYQFKVIDTDDINAFALPGGFIYVNRGLINEASNEAELAGVISHEIGHVAAKHGAKRMTKLIALQIGLATFWGLSDQDQDDQIKLLIAEAVATGFLLKNSRDNERQADDLGTENLYRAGYDPYAMARFFDKLASEYSPSAVETFLSTHPSPGERVRNVEALIATFPPRQYVSDSQDFQQIKQVLIAGTGSIGTASQRRQSQGFQRQRPRYNPAGAPRRRQ